MLDTKGLDNLIPALEKRLSLVVRKTAFDAQAIAAQQAARDTGAMANSLYVSAPGFSGYGAAKLAVKQANPKADVFDEREKVDTDTKAAIYAILACMVHYGIYLEFGTARQPAQPFFLSAISIVEASFLKACAQATKEAAVSGGIMPIRTNL